MDNLEIVIDDVIKSLRSFQETALDEDGSKKIITDLGNLHSFFICLHIIKITNIPEKEGMEAVKLFHGHHLEILQYYLTQLYKIAKKDKLDDVDLSTIEPIHICTDILSPDMKKHKENRLRDLAEKTVIKLMQEVQGMSFAYDDLVTLAASLSSTFITSLLYSAIHSEKVSLKAVRAALYEIVYRNFQVINTFAEEKLFETEVTFHEKKIEEL